ncbi:MAG: PucR family transcriptional regulator [Breznakia sp.]
MFITVKDIIDLEIFKKYKIISAHNSLNNKVESASFIEVPNYKKYMVPNSILISTLLQAKDDPTFLYNFILESKAANISALVLKNKGHLNNLEQKTIDLANKLDVTMIVLEDDCNLSTVLANISNLIFSSQTTLKKSIPYSYNLSERFSNSKNFESLIEIIKSMQHFDVYIEFNDQAPLFSSKKIQTLITQNKSIKQKNLSKIDDQVIIKNEVISNDNLYCTFYLSSSVEHQVYALHLREYIEFIILFLKSNHDLQKEKNKTRLEKFLRNLARISRIDSNLLSIINPIKFPLAFLFYKVRVDLEGNTKTIQLIQSQIMDQFKIAKENVFYYHTEKYTIFILEASQVPDLESSFYHLIQNSFAFISDFYTKVYCSKLVKSAGELNDTYLDSLSLISILEKHEINRPNIFLNDFATLNLLKNVDHRSLLSFMIDNLKGLFLKEDTNHELLETLATLIQTNFQLKLCANRLFIHYNTLRYRITQLRKLGFDIKTVNFNSSDVSLAITIYYFVYLPNLRTL